MKASPMKRSLKLSAVAGAVVAIAGASALGLAQMRGELAYDSAASAGGTPEEQQMGELLDRIEAASTRKEQASAELDALVKRVNQTRSSVRLRIRALYRLTRAGMLPITGGFESMLQHAGRMRRLQRMVETDAKLLMTDKERRVALRGEVATLGRSIEESRAKLNQLQEQSGAAKKALFESEFQQAFNAPTTTVADDRPFYGMRLSDAAPVTRFESLRGSLAFPVSGDVIVRDATRAESDGPGLEFLAQVGTPVRAVAAGRVAFNDVYGSYGRLVIVDHGESYYSVYGGLGIVEVRVGDDLSRSARLGAVGGDHETPALFFEMRKGTRTIPPRPWLDL